MNNNELLKLVRKLNHNQEGLNARHKAQLNRLRGQAIELGALGNKNYLNAKELAIQFHREARQKLVKNMNKIVAELARNSTSSQIRRNLYAEGVRRGRSEGTSQEHWQTWVNKLYRMPGGARNKEIENFFKQAAARGRRRPPLSREAATLVKTLHANIAAANAAARPKR